MAVVENDVGGLQSGRGAVDKAVDRRGDGTQNGDLSQSSGTQYSFLIWQDDSLKFPSSNPVIAEPSRLLS